MDLEKASEELRIFIKSVQNYKAYSDNKIEQAKLNLKMKKIEDLVYWRDRTCLDLLGRILYFEDKAELDITQVIKDLDEAEMEIIQHVKKLPHELSHQPLTKKNNSYIGFIKSSINKMEQRSDDTNYTNKSLIHIGENFSIGILQPYFDLFNVKEQNYIKQGYRLYLEDTYEKALQKEIKYLKAVEVFGKIGNSIKQAGVDMHKSLSETGKKVGDSVRSLDDTLMPAIGNALIAAGKGIGYLLDKADDLNNEAMINRWRKNVYGECKAAAPNAPDWIMEQKFIETLDAAAGFVFEECPKIDPLADNIKGAYFNEHGKECPDSVLKAELVKVIGEENAKYYLHFNENINFFKSAFEYYRDEYKK